MTEMCSIPLVMKTWIGFLEKTQDPSNILPFKMREKAGALLQKLKEGEHNEQLYLELTKDYQELAKALVTWRHDFLRSHRLTEAKAEMVLKRCGYLLEMEDALNYVEDRNRRGERPSADVLHWLSETHRKEEYDRFYPVPYIPL